MQLYSKKRRVTVNGDKLIVDCVPEELEEDNLPEIKKVIGEPNEEYRRFWERQQLAKQDKAARLAEDKKKLDELQKNIKFD